MKTTNDLYDDIMRASTAPTTESLDEILKIMLAMNNRTRALEERVRGMATEIYLLKNRAT